jgi:cytochrome c biogenesis protein CcmG/thiol:disulfide interchange protein DsbE
MTGKWIYAAGIAIALLLGYYAWRRFSVAPGLDFSRLKVETLEGESAGVDWFRNHKAIVCFGASWCGPCRQELSDLARVKTQLGDVEVIVVGDEPTEKLRLFRDLGPFPFTFYHLRSSFSSIGIHSIPATYLVAPTGEVRKKVSGRVDWLDPSTREHLLRILAQ